MATRSSAITSQVVGDGEFAARSLGYVWDPILLDYVVATAGGLGGGGGGPATIADGADVAQGSVLDLESVAGAGSVIAILKRIRTLLSGAIAVTGTFWQATQPVSGTFWQATQPVSGPLTDAQLRAAVVPVDVSDRDVRLAGRVKNLDSAGAVIDPALKGQLPAALSGGGNLKVSLAEDGGAVIGVDDNGSSLTVDAPVGTPVFARLSDGAAALIGQKVMASSLPVAIASDQSAVPVTAPTLTKGTQGANGFSVQDLKDAGRVNIMWTLEFSPAAVAEALMTMTESRDGAATSTFTTKVITNGKRLRVLSWNLCVENTLGVNPKRAKLRMRFNTAGAVVVGSPLQGNLLASVATAVNTIGQSALDDFPDGIEYAGDGTKQIGFTLEFPDWVTAAQTGKVYVTIAAYEY